MITLGTFALSLETSGLKTENFYEHFYKLWLTQQTIPVTIATKNKNIMFNRYCVQYTIPILFSSVKQNVKLNTANTLSNCLWWTTKCAKSTITATHLFLFKCTFEVQRSTATTFEKIKKRIKSILSAGIWRSSEQKQAAANAKFNCTFTPRKVTLCCIWFHMTTDIFIDNVCFALVVSKRKNYYTALKVLKKRCAFHDHAHLHIQAPWSQLLNELPN